MNKKKEVNKSNSINLIIIMYTSALAPIIARVLDLYLGQKNLWTAERIIALYLASVSGYIVSDKIYRVVNNSVLYERGFKLGDSDALRNLIWMMPVCLLISNYDSILALVCIGLFYTVAIIILTMDIEVIIINISVLSRIYFYTLLIIGISLLIGPLAIPVRRWIWLLFVQMIVCLVWDLIAIRKKRKETA